jgi:catechol 2,3-dioxygenase-like lactoylglutathione lyase family enzyme
VQKVLGFGGFFFRARDPAGLASWYERHLGIAPMPAKQDDPVWAQQAGPTVFAPFPEDTDYFGAGRAFMLNFRVADLDAMVAALREAGVEVTLMADADPNGRFARLHDPEGTSVELWEAPQA